MAGGVIAAVVIGVVQYANAVPELYADPSKVPSVNEVSPSPRWLAAVEQGRTLTRTAVTEQNLPGLSVAVGVAGEIVWAEGFGWADIEDRVPVSPGMRVRFPERQACHRRFCH